MRLLSSWTSRCFPLVVIASIVAASIVLVVNVSGVLLTMLVVVTAFTNSIGCTKQYISVDVHNFLIVIVALILVFVVVAVFLIG